MKLLLPYAYDIDGNLVHIDDAIKGVRYTCPSCGAELSLKISQIPPGQKYHRRNHFAHKGNSENLCSESFLHKLFKDRCAELLREKISKNESLYFEWRCEKCYEIHSGNLLKKAVTVVTEYNLDVCKPDIALLDINGKVVIVIEVVVTHRPEPEVLEYYDKHKIACLQIVVGDFDDCDCIKEKLSNPNCVNICPNPTCEKCGEKMHYVKMVTVTTECWRCNQAMKVAMLVADNGREILSPSEFNEEEISIAKSLGSNIAKRYSKTVKDSYVANVCGHCNTFVGGFYMHEYYNLPHDNEIGLSFKCFNCFHNEQNEKRIAEMEASKKMADKLFELKVREKGKQCPICGGLLLVRTGPRGPFWGCANYPSCKHTENIVLE